MKLIFLDIDGVLVIARCYPPSGSQANAWPECVKALNHVIASTGAHMVLSSTWRFDGLMPMRAKLREWGVNGALIGITSWPPKRTREDEILEWLDDHHRSDEVESFVILDDEGMDNLKPHAIRTSMAIGLTMADAERAVELLNR